MVAPPVSGSFLVLENYNLNQLEGYLNFKCAKDIIRYPHFSKSIKTGI